MQYQHRVVPRLFAVECIRRMRGGTQSKLLRCSDGRYHVVKFQKNPQGTKVLANELLATLLAKVLGLPVSEPAIVEVHPDLIRYSKELVIYHRNGIVPCRPGLCFGSLYGNDDPSHANLSSAYDLFPESLLEKVHNLSDFLGMLVFDKWIGNMDPRQTIFIRTNSLCHPYRVLMIDHGLSFNGARWNFPDYPREGLYSERAVYAGVRGMDAFELWLNRLDRYVDRDALDQAAREIPTEWYRGDFDSLNQLLDRLDERRKRIRDLLLSTRSAAPEFFPAWLCRERTSLRRILRKQHELRASQESACKRASASSS
jgi:hypothetical protein